MAETMKTISVRRTHTVTEDRTFTFPVYTEYWCDTSTVYVQTNADLSTVEITIQELTISDSGSTVPERGEIKFSNGTGWLPHDAVREIKREAFAAALARLRAMLEKAGT